MRKLTAKQKEIFRRAAELNFKESEFRLCYFSTYIIGMCRSLHAISDNKYLTYFMEDFCNCKYGYWFNNVKEGHQRQLARQLTLLMIAEVGEIYED